MTNKKIFGTISLVLAILSVVVPTIISLDSLNAELIFVTVFLLFGIASVVFGFLGKKESKGLSIAGIVIGIISIILLCVGLAGMLMYKSATDCVDNGNKTSTCVIFGEKIEIPSSYLNDDQMKKGE
jgi:MFS family permease